MKKLDEKQPMTHVFRLQKKASLLYPVCYENSTNLKSEEFDLDYVVILFAQSIIQEFMIVTGKGTFFKEAWNNALSQLNFMMKKRVFQIRDLRANVVRKVEKKKLEDVNQELANLNHGDWHYGIALDKGFNYAFIEEELNLLGLIRYDDNGIYLRKINEYMLALNRPQVFCLDDWVYCFEVDKYICDANQQVIRYE